MVKDAPAGDFLLLLIINVLFLVFTNTVGTVETHDQPHAFLNSLASDIRWKVMSYTDLENTGLPNDRPEAFIIQTI